MTTAAIPTTAVNRKLLFTFLVIVSILSAITYMLAFSGSGENTQGALALLQFSPAVAAYLFWRKRSSLPQFQSQDDPQSSTALEQAALSESV